MSDSESPVYSSPSNDAEMEQAATKARQTFKYFWREWSWDNRRIVPGLEVAAVKATFSDPPEVRARNPEGVGFEHMWIRDVDFDGKKVYGILVNSPQSLQTFHEREAVAIPGTHVVDWMYVLGGHVFGGFTVDLLRSRMNGSDRRQHDRAWGFDFGPVGVTQLVPPEYIGEPPLPRKGLFSLFSKGSSSSQDPARVATSEHPMSIEMRSSIDESLTKDPKSLERTNERGLNLLHQLALAGSWEGVDVCLQHGADVRAKASNGMTAYTLAKSLGWKRVMERLQQAGGS